MFGNNSELEQEVKELKAEIKAYKRDLKKREEEIEELERKIDHMEEDHSREMDHVQKEHEFEMAHFKDDEIETLRKQKTSLEQKLAVTENENKMLGKIVDVNKDIVDVKKLVETLIEKLPTVNISSIVAGSSKK